MTLSKIGEKILRDMRDTLQEEQRARDLQKDYDAKVKEMRDLLEEVGKILNSDPNDEGKEER